MTRAGLYIADTLEAYAAQALSALPPRVQVLLAGGAPVEIDGQRLAPDLQLVLAAQKRLGAPGLTHEDYREARARFRRDNLLHRGKLEPVASVRDLVVEGDTGPLRARHYVPEQPEGDAHQGARALMVYFHGGGFVLGDLDTHDGVCRALAHHSGVAVLSVEYRLAPEHRFPAAFDDSRAAFLWAVEHAEALGADPAGIGVGGDSAGANLAATVALATSRNKGPKAAFQLLMYPTIDRTRHWPSLDLFADGFVLTRQDITWFDAHYSMLEGGDPADPRVTPMRAKDLTGLPPAVVITAAFDPLRDEGEAYAAALEGAGNHTVLVRMPGLVHGFLNLAGVSPSCRQATIEIAQLLASELRQA